jgi:uncharacterized protein YfaQ (DUF2300 family)
MIKVKNVINDTYRIIEMQQQMSYNENNKSARDQSRVSANDKTAMKAKLPSVKQKAFKATI